MRGSRPLMISALSAVARSDDRGDPGQGKWEHHDDGQVTQQPGTT